MFESKQKIFEFKTIVTNSHEAIALGLWLPGRQLTDGTGLTAEIDGLREGGD